MKEGNNKSYQTSGGVGLISSRLTVEGPIQKEKSSFIISGRRTYADLLAKLSPDFKDIKLYFYDYDLNAKANLGGDWGNATATLRWNSILSRKLFSNTSLIYSNYDFNVGFQSNGSEVNYNSAMMFL